MKKILVLAAHSDDELMGAGGTLAKLIAESNIVHCLILGEGQTARYNNRFSEDRREVMDLYQMSKNVAEFMGFEVELMNFPDNRFDTVPLLDIIKAIEKVKNKVKPDVIYTHYWNDLNIDHKITFNATLTACRPINGETVREIYSYETPSASEWTNYSQGSFKPNVYVDITGFVEIKNKALSFYERELREAPHPRSIKSLETVAKRNGILIGTEYAEAFQLVRKIM